MRPLTTLCPTVLLTPADAARGGTARIEPVLEIVRFRLVDGTDAAAFVRLAQDTEAVVRKQPGFISRRLVSEPEGGWTDIIEWSSHETATNAAAVILSEPDFAPFAAAIDMATVEMSHPALVWRMD